MTDQYEGWNREMLLTLIRELKNQDAAQKQELSDMIDATVLAIDNYRQRIAELESGNQWRTLTETDLPRVFEAFLLEWDCHWQRATMLGVKDRAIALDWHGEKHIVSLDDLEGRRWMRVHRLPKAKEQQAE